MEIATLAHIRQERMIAIVRGLAPQHMLRLAEALLRGGMRMIEVTFAQAAPESWAGTAQSIESLAREFPGDILPGAGTVMTAEQVRIAQQAGAQYIISPHVDEAVIRATKNAQLLSLPGALTPTEAVQAFALGADAVKIFPAGQLGPAYIQALKAPLAHIPLLAVGGITEANAAAFLRAGAIGLGIGGNLVNRQWIEEGAWPRITALAQAYRQAVAQGGESGE